MTGNLTLKTPEGIKDITSDLFEDNDEETAAGRLYKHGRIFEMRGVSITINRLLDDIQIEIGIGPLPEPEITSKEETTTGV